MTTTATAKKASVSTLTDYRREKGIINNAQLKNILLQRKNFLAMQLPHKNREVDGMLKNALLRFLGITNA